MSDELEQIERMAYLTSGGRERTVVDKQLVLTLFYETWFEWKTNVYGHDHSPHAEPTNGFVVGEGEIQHRFKTLSEADAFLEALELKYATRMGLYALGIR
jgi:hypothetical protein